MPTWPNGQTKYMKIDLIYLKKPKDELIYFIYINLFAVIFKIPIDKDKGKIWPSSQYYLTLNYSSLILHIRIY